MWRREEMEGGCLPVGKASSSCVTRAISSFSRCCHGEGCGGGGGGSELMMSHGWKGLLGILEQRQSPTSFL